MLSIIDVLGNFERSGALSRLGIPFALGLVVALLLNIDPHWYWPGLVVSVVGLLLLLWTLGSVRSRKTIPVNGPYMFVRNPTYIASFFLILGLVLMAGAPWLLLIYVPLYVVYTIYRVTRHEQELEDEFGMEYVKYSKHVPRFMPHLKPYREGRLWFFSRKHFKRQYGEIVCVLFAVLYIVCYVTAFYFK